MTVRFTWSLPASIGKARQSLRAWNPCYLYRGPWVQGTISRNAGSIQLRAADTSTPVVRVILTYVDIEVPVLVEADVGDPEIRESVRRRYADLAVSVDAGGSCCGPDEGSVFGSMLYGADDLSAVPGAAAAASLGCGNPTAVAELQPGQIVLDLGSGGGIDVILSARRVAPGGKAYGLDMTDEMLELARRNAAEAGVDNVEFLKGQIERIPLQDSVVDVVISNCVINLSTDKRAVIGEALRVLRPGGTFAVSDVVADPDMDEATRLDMQQWTGCIAGALTREEYSDLLEGAGFVDIAIRETHKVHSHAASAIIRAQRPL